MEADVSDDKTSYKYANVWITTKPKRGFVDPSMPSPAAIKARDARLARAADARKYLTDSARTVRA